MVLLSKPQKKTIITMFYTGFGIELNRNNNNNNVLQWFLDTIIYIGTYMYISYIDPWATQSPSWIGFCLFFF